MHGQLCNMHIQYSISTKIVGQCLCAAKIFHNTEEIIGPKTAIICEST